MDISAEYKLADNENEWMYMPATEPNTNTIGGGAISLLQKHPDKENNRNTGTIQIAICLKAIE